MSALWKAWVALWSKQETAEPVALFRIAVGLCIVMMLVHDIPNRGFIWVEHTDGGYRTILKTKRMMALLGGHTFTVVNGLLATIVVTTITLILGVFPRLSALISLQCHLALASSGQPGGGQDQLLHNALWLLVLARSDATLSLTARLRTKQWRPAVMVSSWPRYLIIFQLLLLYQAAGYYKVSTHWHPGGDLRALYYALNTPIWNRWDFMTLWGMLFPLTQVATLVSWLFENLGPVLLLLALCFRSTRTRSGRLRAAFNRLPVRNGFVLVGLSMHLGIWLMMEVGVYSPLAMAFYPCLFHPDELRAAGKRWLGSRHSSVSSPCQAEDAETSHTAG